jgi:hypothetical protein
VCACCDCMLVSSVDLDSGEAHAKSLQAFAMDLRIDFVRRIPPNHVVEYEFAAGMFILPRIWDSQDVVLEDNDCLAIGDKVRNPSPGLYVGSDHGEFCKWAKNETWISEAR